MIGLVDRFVWVLPEWADEANNDNNNSDIFSATLDLGLATVTTAAAAAADTSGGAGEQMQTVLCQCETDDDDDDDDANAAAATASRKQCWYVDYSLFSNEETQQDPQVKIASDACKIVRSYEFETLTASQMSKLLRENDDYLRSDEQLILDIDEDYFAVELPGDALLAGGIWRTTVELIDSTAK